MEKGFGEGFHPSSPAAEPIILVLSPRPGRPLDCILLANRVVYRELHFDTDAGEHGRDVPCVGLPRCGWCKAGIKWKVKHYWSACLLSTRKPFVLQVSDGGTQDARRILAALGDHRGVVLKVTRTDRRKEARMKVEEKGRWTGEALPDAFDVIPTLERTWGLTGGAGTLKTFQPGHLEPGELAEGAGA